MFGCYSSVIVLHVDSPISRHSTPIVFHTCIRFAILSKRAVIQYIPFPCCLPPVLWISRSLPVAAPLVQGTTASVAANAAAAPGQSPASKEVRLPGSINDVGEPVVDDQAGGVGEWPEGITRALSRSETRLAWFDRGNDV